MADLIDKEQWNSLEADVKRNAYEGQLEKNAADTAWILWQGSISHFPAKNLSITRTNSSGSSKNGRCPLFSNTANCEPGIA